MTANKPSLGLTALMLAYGAASLAHFAHNAVFIDAYPNLPAWLSSGDVWLTWFAEAAIGLTGYVLLRRGHAMVGLVLIGVWAAFGFDGLAHYWLAPIDAHTLAMNVTIWTEVCAAALLLTHVAITLPAASSLRT